MCDPILVTVLKIQPHYSQSSRENATPSSGTSPVPSYKEVPPPPRGLEVTRKCAATQKLVQVAGYSAVKPNFVIFRPSQRTNQRLSQLQLQPRRWTDTSFSGRVCSRQRDRVSTDNTVSVYSYFKKGCSCDP